MIFRGNLFNILIVLLCFLLIGSGCSSSKNLGTGTSILAKDNHQDLSYGENINENDALTESEFTDCTSKQKLTVPLDHGGASYSQIRKYLNNNQCILKETVKIEEMINYFRYDYPIPKGKDLFSMYTEVNKCPWNSQNMLILIGLRAKKIDVNNVPQNNIVLLIDISGSMKSEDKLPLAKKTLKLLVEKLKKEDKISIVTYSGFEDIKLNAVSVNEKGKINKVIDDLNPRGITVEDKGIETAYKIAKDNFVKKGNNRIIFVTDGEFNIKKQDENELYNFIEEKKNEGIFLSALGFGSTGYKAAKMSMVAKKGGGMYTYIDDYTESKKFVEDMSRDYIYSVATATQLEVEFEKNKVNKYRIIGFEGNLQNEQIDNKCEELKNVYSDQTFTVLYEIKCIPNIKFGEKIFNAKLKYTNVLNNKDTNILNNKDTNIIEKSEIINKANKEPSDNFILAASVAEFGLVLKKSKSKGIASPEHIIELAGKCRNKELKVNKDNLIKLVNMYNENY